MNKQDKIKELLEEMSDSELLSVYMEYCDSANICDGGIYDMDDFDEIMSGSEPWEIARSCFYGDFRPCDKYFSFNGYGNLISFDYISEHIYIDDIARYIIDNEDALNNDDIQEILDEEEADEE